MKTIAVLAIVATLAATVFIMSPSRYNDSNSEFDKYIVSFDKSYATEDEYNFRSQAFAQQMAKIRAHNARNDISFEMGLNEFSDWTPEEYKKMLGYKPQFKNPEAKSMDNDFPVNCPEPTEMYDIDWRQSGHVTPVKNQGRCGSCWAFSAVGALEGAYFTKFGSLKSFSEEQLVECDTFSHGCNGGLMENGFFHWMRRAPRTEDEYPYVAPKVDACHEGSVPTDVPLISIGYRVDVGWECLWEALTHGVVSVAIRAENDTFRAYKGGVIDDYDGCGIDLDHGVTLVGYSKADDAWIIKNSWGPNWGENGYVRIRRGTDAYGICGINQQNSRPIF